MNNQPSTSPPTFQQRSRDGIIAVVVVVGEHCTYPMVQRPFCRYKGTRHWVPSPLPRLPPSPAVPCTKPGDRRSSNSRQLSRHSLHVAAEGQVNKKGRRRLGGGRQRSTAVASWTAKCPPMDESREKRVIEGQCHQMGILGVNHPPMTLKSSPAWAKANGKASIPEPMHTCKGEPRERQSDTREPQMLPKPLIATSSQKE